jgi:alpha-galactosidase
MSDSHLAWAPTPPMGWNSWDCFGVSITEAEVRENAAFMAKHLKDCGWEYVVIDIDWYAPEATTENYKQYGLKQLVDPHGRPIPDPVKFPSSADGGGFTQLAEYVHSLGLKFGIHLMRGMPFQAAEQKCIIEGTDITCDQIADSKDRCPWYANTVGVKLTAEGGQAYYDSLTRLFASWGVDFIKADDMNSWDGGEEATPYHTDEIEALRRAIDKSGRPMVLSLSPGAALVCNARHLRESVNMFRISADFWDDWDSLKRQFSRCARWAEYIIVGSWPDPDMLPLGRIGIRGEVGEERKTHFLPAEQRTLMTLWCIFRAPLMFGGHLPGTDEATLALIQNKEVLEVNQMGADPACLWQRGDLIAWSSKAPGGGFYLGLFNHDDLPRRMDFLLAELGLTGAVSVRDLWERSDLGTFTGTLPVEIPAHGAVLYKLLASTTAV